MDHIVGQNGDCTLGHLLLRIHNVHYTTTLPKTNYRSMYPHCYHQPGYKMYQNTDFSEHSNICNGIKIIKLPTMKQILIKHL